MDSIERKTETAGKETKKLNQQKPEMRCKGNGSACSKSKKSSGRRIRGRLTFFKNSSLDRSFAPLKYQLDHDMRISEASIHEHRTLFKKEIARRFAYATEKAGVFEPITPTSKQLLTDFLRLQSRHPFVYSNVDCILTYYNSAGRENAFRCGRKSPLKNVLQHAAMDCLKAEEYYIRPFMKASSSYWCKTDGELHTKLKEMHSALVFIRFFFRTFYCDLVPAKLVSDVFNTAFDYDERMAKLYYFSREAGIYIRAREKRYHSVNQECAAYLICQKMCYLSMHNKNGFSR